MSKLLPVLNPPLASIPVGFCGCGCGSATPIARRTDSRKGWVAGHPTRFCYGHRRRSTIADRMERLVDRGAGPNECWPFRSRKNHKGYGELQIAGGQVVFAHRVAYALEHGDVPDGLHVCHRCDNPACCNPAGTP